MQRTTRTKPHHRLWDRLTWLLLTFTLADAVYIFTVVQKMTENTSLAMERYHAVPIMTEHVLCALVLYLGGMILASKATRS